MIEAIIYLAIGFVAVCVVLSILSTRRKIDDADILVGLIVMVLWPLFIVFGVLHAIFKNSEEK